MAEMKAARYDRYGAPEVLYVGTIPIPTAKPEEVLVRVYAASVNGIDLIVTILSGRSWRRVQDQPGLKSVIAFGE